MVELVGGPWCGVAISVPDTAGWLWLEGSPERLNRPRAFGQPGRDRTLYRRDGRRLEFSDYHHVACAECGLLHRRCDDHGQRLKECTLCGASLSRTRV